MLLFISYLLLRLTDFAADEFGCEDELLETFGLLVLVFFTVEVRLRAREFVFTEVAPSVTTVFPGIESPEASAASASSCFAF